MTTIKVNNAKDYFKAIHKLQRGWKNEAYADMNGKVYKDGKCVGQVIIEA